MWNFFAEKKNKTGFVLILSKSLGKKETNKKKTDKIIDVHADSELMKLL